MNQPVNCCRCDHRIFEYPAPLTENQITGNHQAAAFAAFGQKGEEHCHLF